MTKQERIERLQSANAKLEEENSELKELAYRITKGSSVYSDEKEEAYRELYTGANREMKQLRETIDAKKSELTKVWFLLRENLQHEVADDPEKGVYQNPFTIHVEDGRIRKQF